MILFTKKYDNLRTRKNILEIKNSFFILTLSLIFNNFLTNGIWKKNHCKTLNYRPF